MIRACTRRNSGSPADTWLDLLENFSWDRYAIKGKKNCDTSMTWRSVSARNAAIRWNGTFIVRVARPFYFPLRFTSFAKHFGHRCRKYIRKFAGPRTRVPTGVPSSTASTADVFAGANWTEVRMPSQPRYRYVHSRVTTTRPWILENW